ncbi:protein FAM200C-like [Scylla paramamosain]|uniref:protein FAM200C-like n=1 Tax=Scylla paramamosain TaxID=85552 RepID=UPI0030828BC6
MSVEGAPVMLGQNSAFGALVKADAPHIIVTHCVLHRHALATKNLPPKLAEVLKIVVDCVKYVRNSALKHRIFKELCNEMGSEFEQQHCHADCFENSEFILILVYMADIFDALNHLNQQMQGGGANIIKVEEKLKT